MFSLPQSKNILLWFLFIGEKAVARPTHKVKYDCLNCNLLYTASYKQLKYCLNDTLLLLINVVYLLFTYCSSSVLSNCFYLNSLLSFSNPRMAPFKQFNHNIYMICIWKNERTCIISLQTLKVEGMPSKKMPQL